MEAMTGVKAESIVGKDNFEHAIPFYGQRRPTVANLIVCPDPIWESRYLEFRKEKAAIFSLGYCANLPGGAAFVSGKTSVIRDLNNRLYGSIHYLRDVTREREMQRDLQESKSQYEILMDYAQIGILDITQKGITYFNNRLKEFVGSGKRGITLTRFFAWVHNEDREAIRAQINEMLSGRIQFSRLEFRAIHNRGTQYYRYFAHSTENEGKRTLHFFLEDITTHKELEEKLRQHRAKMYHEERLASLGTMATGIAHELNQPLNTVRVITDGILYGKEMKWNLPMDELYDKLSMISRQVVRMSDVIQNVREFGREDQSKIVEDVDVNEAVRNVLSMTNEQLKAHGIQCSLELSPGLPNLQASRGRLEQVIMNLVINARQALDTSNKARKRMRVTSHFRDGAIQIEVHDNATGIAPDIVSKIFDPFFTTKQAAQGTGLGLSISKSIISEMKGTMQVSNNDQGGATFVIGLPPHYREPR
jgi:PAS domain S-box-containing protein